MGDFYEHIDDYKNGLLSGEALTLFEAQMKRDASLQIAVDNYNAAKSISEGLLEVDMLETLQNIGKSKNETLNTQNNDNRTPSKINRSPQINDRSVKTDTKPVVSIFNLRTLMAAASIIGVIFFAGWWMTGSSYSHLDKEQVLASFVDPVNEDATKSVDTIGMTAFEKGMHFYALNRYEESEDWLKLSLEEEIDKKMRSRGYYWLGAAHLRQWEVDEAVGAWEESDEEKAKESLEYLK